MEEEKVKYIRGVEGRGEEIKRLFTGMCLDVYIQSYYQCEDPSIVYFLDEQNELVCFPADSTIGKLIIANGEEMFLPPTYKFKAGDKVVIKSKGLYENKVVTIIEPFSIQGDPFYFTQGQGQESESRLIFKEDSLELYVEPQIKTWDDLIGKPLTSGYYIDGDGNIEDVTDDYYFYDCDRNVAATEKVAKAMLAMAQISQLMLHYGGIITEEEWKDDSIAKFVIYPSNNQKTGLDWEVTDDNYYFLAFRTEELCKEFLSYPKNIQLAKDLYMMD